MLQVNGHCTFSSGWVLKMIRPSIEGKGDFSVPRYGTNMNDRENKVGAAIQCLDLMLEETRTIYDMNNSVMESGSLYVTMEQFRLAIR